MGTDKLEIIDDLLESINYRSLWCDGEGQYRTGPFNDPPDRPIAYEREHPFTYGEGSLMSPDWERDNDIFSVPNRYVAISMGDGQQEAMTAVASNEDPNSPFSYYARGRWITHVKEGVEASTQADLDALARQGLSALTSVTTTLTVNHLYLPDLRIDDVVRFTNTPSGLDVLALVSETSIPLDPTALSQSEFREIVDL